jgi:hypothetical protein
VATSGWCPARWPLPRPPARWQVFHRGAGDPARSARCTARSASTPRLAAFAVAGQRIFEHDSLGFEASSPAGGPYLTLTRTKIDPTPKPRCQLDTGSSLPSEPLLDYRPDRRVTLSLSEMNLKNRRPRSVTRPTKRSPTSTSLELGRVPMRWARTRSATMRPRKSPLEVSTAGGSGQAGPRAGKAVLRRPAEQKNVTR